MAHLPMHNITGMNVPRSQSYEGRFGRLFREMKWQPPGNTADEIEAGIRDFTNEHMFNKPDEDDPSDNPNIPAGYTYFGQFIDHDITFDPTSSLMRQNDPDRLKNFRSPSLDLDNVYGRGHADQPYMYDDERKGPDGTAGYFLIGTGENANEPDLPRNSQNRALIGDMRNDENVIVAQIQLCFLKLHNRILSNITGDQGATNEQFEEAQRIMRWFYQYVVWNDFIKRLVADTVWADALKLEGTEWKANKRFYNPKYSAYMPVEFSVAAYRFGHSLIRPAYQVNNVIDVGLPQTGFGLELPIFDPTKTGKPDLGGFKRLKDKHTIQWDWYLNMPTSGGPFPQNSQLIDRKLSRGVFHIDVGGGKTNPLAFLNVMRGWRMELPSGPDVATAMGFTPITLEHEHEKSLWVYMLREAEKLPGANAGKQMGPVGGTIMAHVFAGLLKKDDNSYFNLSPNWKPDNESALPFDAPLGSDWEFADIIRAGDMPLSAEDIDGVLAGGATS